MDMLARVWNAALDVLFPPACVACGIKTSATDPYPSFCRQCAESVILRDGFSCPTCCARIPTLSGRCHAAAFPLAAAVSYAGAAAELVHAAKYRGIASAIDPMAGMLAAYTANLVARAEFSFAQAALVPIPLHKSRERARGYNQAHLLAERAACSLGIDIPVVDALVRIRETVPQIKCKKPSDRERNITGAFSCDPHLILPYEYLIIADDVTTSGATLREAFRALKKAGARHVAGLVFAKA